MLPDRPRLAKTKHTSVASNRAGASGAVALCDRNPVREFPKQADRDFSKSGTSDFAKSRTECGSAFGSAVRAVSALRVILGRGNAEAEANETDGCERPTNDPALGHEHGLSVRAISERLQLSKSSVATYLWRAREAD
jgi:hypothetical protein